MGTLPDGQQVPIGDMQRVVTGQQPRPQLVPQVCEAALVCILCCSFLYGGAGGRYGIRCAALCLAAALACAGCVHHAACCAAGSTHTHRPPGPAPPPPCLQFGYISLFPLLMRLIPPASPVLGRQLELLRDPARLWTEYGLRSLRSAVGAARHGQAEPEQDGGLGGAPASPAWRVTFGDFRTASRLWVV